MPRRTPTIDPVLRAHQEWLGYLQLADLLTQYLGWDSDQLSRDPQAIASHTRELPELGETLAPTAVVPAAMGDGAQLLVAELPLAAAFDPKVKGGEHLWRASAQERQLPETGLEAGLLFNGSMLRLVVALKGESSGHGYRTECNPGCASMDRFAAQEGRSRHWEAPVDSSNKPAEPVGSTPEPPPARWLACYRVSADRQGQCSLGLEAKRAKVAAMAAERGAVIAAEFVEVESGGKNDRPQLAVALAQARAEQVVIAVAKSDRLARDAGFVLKLANEAEKNGIGGFVFCDPPDIDATSSTGRMVLMMMARVAEFEARRIGACPREAPAAAQEQGVRLGGDREAAARQSSARRERATAAAAPFRGGWPRWWRPAGAVGPWFRLSLGWARSAAPASRWPRIRWGGILQRLALAGKPLGAVLRLVAI